MSCVRSAIGLGRTDAFGGTALWSLRRVSASCMPSPDRAWFLQLVGAFMPPLSFVPAAAPSLWFLLPSNVGLELALTVSSERHACCAFSTPRASRVLSLEPRVPFGRYSTDNEDPIQSVRSTRRTPPRTHDYYTILSAVRLEWFSLTPYLCSATTPRPTRRMVESIVADRAPRAR